jgi:phosphopantothenoylcysteine decarboxylase/phosphopantothenate--cysteine ligase
VYLKDIAGTLGNELSGKRIALCVTGSVSITEAPRIARLLMRHGADVIPVLTSKACEFVSPMIFEWSTGNTPITKLTGRVEHVELVSSKSSRRVDLILIAPCTANTIARISSGISDEPVSTLVCTALGSGIPIMIASAMHEPMVKNPIIQEAKIRLEKAGIKFIEGKIVESKSKLAEPDEIVREVISEICKPESDGTLGDMSLIITAGPTREPIDQVRFITNASSGKMGVALAEAALSKGAKRVCLIHGPGVVVPSALREAGNGRVHIESVVTTQEMQDSVLSNLSKAGKYDILISAGAPADYTSVSPATGKIKTSEKPSFKIELSASKKIIAVAKEKFPKTFVVAFKAQYGSVKLGGISREAQEVFKTSKADIVVANDVGRSDIGFGSDFNEVSVVSKDGRVRNLPRASKNEIAAKILDILVEEIGRYR